MTRPTAERVRRWMRDQAVVVPLVTVTAFFVSGVVQLLRPWTPVEDLAITELMVRQIGHDTPLVGAYSSLPFNHPGPSLFFYLWGPYQLLGERSSSMLAATVWFNGAVLAFTLVLARRLGGRLLPALIAGAVLVFARANDWARLLQPWNPYVGAMPLLALVLVTWALLEGRRWLLPVAAGLASWAVQAHIEFVPTAGALAILGSGGLAVATVRTDGRQGLVRLAAPVAAAVAVGLLLWLAPLIDLAANGSDSNLATIVRVYGSSEGPTVPASEAVLVLRSELSLRPAWADGPRPYDLFISAGAEMVPWMVVPLLLAVAGSGRRRAWAEVRGVAVAATSLLVSFLALTRVRGTSLGSWYLIPADVSSLVLVCLVAWSLARTVLAAVRSRAEGRSSRLLDRWTPVLRAGLVVATAGLVVLTAMSMERRPAEETTARAARRMLPAVLAAVPDGSSVHLEATSGSGAWVLPVFALELDRRGHDVTARTTLEGKFPPAMSGRPDPDSVRIVVVTNPAPDIRWHTGVHVVAEERYRLSPEEDPLHVVVMSAPMELWLLSEPG